MVLAGARPMQESPSQVRASPREAQLPSRSPTSAEVVRDSGPGDASLPSADAATAVADVPAGTRFVPGGEVVIGQPERTGRQWGRPQSGGVPRVPIAAFAIDMRPVSTAEYMARARADTTLTVDWSNCAASPTSSAAPIACVTWTQATRYCELRGGRLPRLAEWERVAELHAEGVTSSIEYEWVEDRSPSLALRRGPPQPCVDEKRQEYPRCRHTRSNPRSPTAPPPRYNWNISFEARRVHSLGFRCAFSPRE